MLQEREMKIRNELDKLRQQREMLRRQRRKYQFPVVAVVGYTNAGALRHSVRQCEVLIWTPLVPLHNERKAVFSNRETMLRAESFIRSPRAINGWKLEAHFAAPDAGHTQVSFRSHRLWMFPRAENFLDWNETRDV